MNWIDLDGIGKDLVEGFEGYKGKSWLFPDMAQPHFVLLTGEKEDRGDMFHQVYYGVDPRANGQLTPRGRFSLMNGRFQVYHGGALVDDPIQLMGLKKKDPAVFVRFLEDLDHFLGSRVHGNVLAHLIERGFQYIGGPQAMKLGHRLSQRIDRPFTFPDGWRDYDNGELVALCDKMGVERLFF